MEICNGCDFLIATPTSFQYLLKSMKLFRWLNLDYFVFDNMDLLLENYKEQVIITFKLMLFRATYFPGFPSIWNKKVWEFYFL